MRFEAALCVLVAAMAFALPLPSASADDDLYSIDEMTLTWSPPAAEGEMWRYPMDIWRPDEPADCGLRVMLLGGGLSHDLSWRVPGFIENYDGEGGRAQLTISGRETRDGDTLAQALVGAGYTVWRYGAVRAGDPLRAQNEAFASALPFDESIELARAAYERFLEVDPCEERSVVLLGHSLGATRSVLIADAHAAGIISMGGAYLAPFGGSPMRGNAEALDARPGLDADGDGRVVREEYDAWQGDLAPFDEIDFDDDGVLRDWEIAGADRVRSWLADPPGEEAPGGGPWAHQRLSALRVPSLVIYGEDDAHCVNAPWLGAHAKSGLLGRMEIRILPGIGHQMCVEEPAEPFMRVGPMDERVVRMIVAWMRDVCAAQMQ